MLHRSVLKHVSARLYDYENEVQVAIGAYTWTRDDLNRLGVAQHCRAARTLSDKLRKLGVSTNTRFLAIDPFSLGRIKGIGETALLVAMALVHDLGGNVDVWWDKNIPGNTAAEKVVSIVARTKRHKHVA